MAAYLTIDQFKLLSIAPATYVDAIEALEPGWTDAQLGYWSGWIDSRLSKRYLAPFALPAPIAAQGWLARLVTYRVYLKRGFNPDDAQAADIVHEAQEAAGEIKEAADSKDGLFELPQADQTSLVAKGAPLTYTEVSPYTWSPNQRAGATQDTLIDGNFCWGGIVN